MADASGYASYSTIASKPTMFGSQTIIGRSMVAHEEPDDFGLANTRLSATNGSMGREIACCTITQFYMRLAVEDADSRNLQDLEPGTEVFTEDEYRQLFGVDFDPEEFEGMDFLQN